MVNKNQLSLGLIVCKTLENNPMSLDVSDANIMKIENEFITYVYREGHKGK